MSRLDHRFPRYAQLLRLYPPKYRALYQKQMLQTLADMLDDPQTNRANVWLRTAVDLPMSLIKQNALAVGETVIHETPNYVKYASLTGALLLLPFFAFITLNGLTAHRLYHSWLWHTPVLFVWIVILPALACTIALTAYLRWSVQRRRTAGTSGWQNLFDWRRNWPMLLIAVLSLGIIALVFGHDSVHCVVQNPVTSIRHWPATWTCIKQG